MKMYLAVAATMMSINAVAQDATGRILVAVGICDQSAADYPVIWFRKVDQSAHYSARGASFGQWSYSDETGKFELHTRMLSAGEWEMFRYELQTKQTAVGPRFTHRPRNDYSHRFTVAPGKLVDLGRYCAATQTSGEKYPDSDKVWNQVAQVAYMHVSANREVDIENARKSEAGGAPLELVPARPDPPERVSPLLRSRFAEPRVIAKPAQNPSAPPTSPVQ